MCIFNIDSTGRNFCSSVRDDLIMNCLLFLANKNVSKFGTVSGASSGKFLLKVVIILLSIAFIRAVPNRGTYCCSAEYE